MNTVESRSLLDIVGDFCFMNHQQFQTFNCPLLSEFKTDGRLPESTRAAVYFGLLTRLLESFFKYTFTAFMSNQKDSPVHSGFVLKNRLQSCVCL